MHFLYTTCVMVYYIVSLGVAKMNLFSYKFVSSYFIFQA